MRVKCNCTQFLFDQFLFNSKGGRVTTSTTPRMAQGLHVAYVNVTFVFRVKMHTCAKAENLVIFVYRYLAAVNIVFVCPCDNNKNLTDANTILIIIARW